MKSNSLQLQLHTRWLVVVLIAFATSNHLFAQTLKPRMLVLTDVSTWETDDHESLIRLMAHADLFEIEGIVVSTGYSISTLNKNPERGFIGIARGVVDAYENDLPNLMKRSGQTGHAHDNDKQEIGYWPSAEYLRERIMFGSMNRGKKFIGDDNGSPGSELIARLADEPDDRPLWIGIWGGGNTLAQAIYQIKKDRTPLEYEKLLNKLRVYAITDQDRSYRGEGLEISSHGWIYEQAGDNLMFLWDEAAWIEHNNIGKSNWDHYAEHIQGHGHLGSQYPKFKYGVEGDTPAFLYLMPNGLNDPEDPTQVSWGGTFKENEDNLWREASSSRSSFRRFYPAAFNNFAARMDWAKDGKGNRNPDLVLNGDGGIHVLTRSVTPGESLTLDASGTTDPDGDQLTFKWFVQGDAGSYQGKVAIAGSESSKATVSVPSDAAGKSLHLICQVTDDGAHNLSSYRRIVLEAPSESTGAPNALPASTAGQSVASWLKDYIAAKYPSAELITHGGGAWYQAKLSEPSLVVSWADWQEEKLTLKYLEAHALSDGRAIFLAQPEKIPEWADHPNVSYYNGAGYFVNAYDSTAMSGWDVSGLTILQFDGDATAFSKEMSVGLAKANKVAAVTVPAAKAGSSATASQFTLAKWLQEYIPETYAGADVVAHGGGAWFQSKLSKPKLIVSWADWKETTLSLKDIEAHGLTEGEDIFVSKTKKTGWDRHPNVTFYEGVGHYISGYEAASMADWDVAETTMLQFTGDADPFVAALAKARASNATFSEHLDEAAPSGSANSDEPAAGAPYLPFPSNVVVTKVRHFDNMCWKIAAAGGTWYFENGETGGKTGFSSAFDQAGNDWIGNDADRGYNKSPSRGGRHEYRGWPNFGEGNFNHPQRGSGAKSWWVDSNGNEIAVNDKLEGDHLIMRSANSDYEVEYHFFSTHASIKVLKANKKYAFLYEGPIGGEQDASVDKDFYVLKDGKHRECKSGGLGFLEPAFGNKFPSPFFYLEDSDPNDPQVWYAGVINTGPESAGDEGWRQGNNMVIFSFGRDQDKRSYTGLDAACVFGFHKKAPHSRIANFIESRLRAPFEQAKPTQTSSTKPAANSISKPRVIVTSDFPPIGVVKGGNVPNTMKSDPDDMQSMVRFLLYSNELEVEGLVASAGTFAMEAHKKNILGVLDQYEKVYDNLRSHDSRYPSPDYLRSVTFEGKGNNHGVPVKFGAGKQPHTDIIGKGKDSEASNAIIAAVDKPDPRPIWISVWGGPREVAQAIWDVQNTRTDAELKRFISKLRIFLIAHQDATHSWLMKEFPDLFIIESRKTYQGMFGGRDPNSDLAWVNEHIRKGHGPLCDIYPHEGMGCSGVCEGDTPAYLHLVSAVRGINNPDDPTQPSWGGQYKRKQGTKHFVDGPGRSSISKWRKEYQNEFQERADWCVQPAN
ncbi:hypothetical protein KOR34_01420 [Posidoniimonas corsicana]|uniref:Ig-like domain-containing protein n=1 Tax=Posidoniimonas corsicana TaxID=1938618 RepID=A0A5C5V9J6_9BACT|nr:DUF1593 domain-containing protein [Posidoniimonas corsicana]TWT35254.1 hypothetical protein KOR34_01420 [Posidoniimonas corsicana]